MGGQLRLPHTTVRAQAVLVLHHNAIELAAWGGTISPSISRLTSGSVPGAAAPPPPALLLLLLLYMPIPRDRIVLHHGRCTVLTGVHIAPASGRWYERGQAYPIPRDEQADPGIGRVYLR
jgi:hypothetical protein